MLEELERRNYSSSTTRTYIRAVEDFARYFKPSPDQPGPDHIRQYQAYLFRERKLAPNTVNQRLAALRFFYIKTLKQSWSTELTPYPKKTLRLQSILSQDEVNSLIEAAPTPFQRTLLMGLYATGLRRAELANLKVTDGGLTLKWNDERWREVWRRARNGVRRHQKREAEQPIVHGMCGCGGTLA
jgi:integrase/recombinase XerD